MNEVFLPKTLDELWDLIEAKGPDMALYAGGTDFLVKVRNGMARNRCAACIGEIGELMGVSAEDEGIVIGACTPFSRLLSEPLLAPYPVLTRAISVLGSPPIRNMATIGGNICTASPAGDSLPPLYVLGAEVELLRRNSSRRIPLEQFITGPGTTDLEPGEVLYSLRLRGTPHARIQHFEKVGQRRALAIAVASMAALIDLDEVGMVTGARLAWGSVAPTVITCPEAEAALTGRRLCRQSLEQAAAAARSAVNPIDDVRAGASYRRQVSGNLLLRLLDYSDKGSR